MDVAALRCDGCDTEVRGHFQRCDYCALTGPQLELLRVFLEARGNTKELERHLGVSYPTARLRLEELLGALGIAARPERDERRALLDDVASGQIPVEEAAARISRSRARR